MTSYTITINNVAQPKKRPRFSRKTGRIYTPTSTQKWEYEVREAASRAIPGPITGPVEVEMLFIFPRPKNRIWKRKPMPREWKTTRGDIDNYIKAVLDGLNGIAFKDDAQIVSLSAQKVIAAGDEIPRVIIHIRALPGYWEQETKELIDYFFPHLRKTDYSPEGTEGAEVI